MVEPVFRAQPCPTISIVIPTFNYGQYVCEAVDAALGQSYRPYEVIVVDDGSTDDTWMRLQPYAARIRYILQKNAGVSAARNRGILAASGEWIAFLDADDLWQPDKLLLQVQCLRMYPEVCMVGALSNRSRFPDARLSGGPLVTLLSTRDLLGASLLTSSSVLARTESLKDSGLFDVRRRWAEDREMWLKLSLRGPAARVNARLWSYRPHATQASANHLACSENYGKMLREFFENHAELRQHAAFATAYYHYDAALSHLMAGSRLGALWHTLAAFARHPRPMRQPYAETQCSRLALLCKALLPVSWFRLLVSQAKSARRILNAPVWVREPAARPPAS